MPTPLQLPLRRETHPKFFAKLDAAAQRQPLKFLSVCSGIEAASVAWKPLGWEAVAFAEIEPFPCAVLQHHYPNIPNLGDMTKFHEWPTDLRFDLLAGGTPCQSFSLAGLREGLADPRGNLALVFLGILERYRPRWVVWENVPGVLSSVSHDVPDPCPPPDPVDVEFDRQTLESDDDYDSEELHAFQCFLAGLSELGYGFAYRTLDAQYFGVPQRRRRPFVIGYLGDWRRAAAVLFEPESLRGDPPPRRETGKGIAGTLTRRALDGSSPCGGDGRDGLMIAESIAPTVTAKWAKGSGGPSGGPSGDECQNLVACQAVGVDYTNGLLHGDLAGTLEAGQDRGNRGQGVLVCVHGTQDSCVDDHLAFALGRNSGQENVICFDTTQVTSAANYSNPKPGDPCHPLAASAHPPTIAFNLRGREGGAMPEVDPDGLASMRAASGGSSRSYLADLMAVRRLTPRECERLQGFEDDYTLIPWGGRPAEKCPDGPRYRALGNSWAIPCPRWIGARIADLERGNA